MFKQQLQQKDRLNNPLQMFKNGTPQKLLHINQKLRKNGTPQKLLHINQKLILGTSTII